MTDAIVVLVTASSADEASRLARAVVDERLAACVNLVAGVRSIYRWQGEVCEDQETLLVIKTGRASFARLERRIAELHSYDVPEVIALPVERGAATYLTWIATQVGDDDQA